MCDIFLESSNSNTISNNNGMIGIKSSRNNKLTNNVMVEGGIIFEGSVLSHYIHDIDESNTVNGKPVYYMRNAKGERIPDGAGQIILANCTNVVVEDQNLNDVSVGIEAAFSSNITIKNNNCSLNGYGINLEYSKNNFISNNNCYSNSDTGIHIYFSSNNSITNNNCSNNEDGIPLYGSSNNIISNNNCSNNDDGLQLMYYSSDNVIYLNNLINNTDNVCSHDSTNIWNSTEKITYKYNGNTYTNYLGNYWDDYNTRTDTDNDGIGDTYYPIDSDKDIYPLMKPFEIYFTSAETIFDTGPGTYPSISGTHNGTITPNQTITVSRLYTYPCSGTGGHSESIKIWNSLNWNVTATWDGYTGDWHNISFSEPFTLVAGETYNYTIRTGSYPQIHHESERRTANGWINSTKFIDANGKIYTDRIPAIMLT